MSRSIFPYFKPDDHSKSKIFVPSEFFDMMTYWKIVPIGYMAKYDVNRGKRFLKIIYQFNSPYKYELVNEITNRGNPSSIWSFQVVRKVGDKKIKNVVRYIEWWCRFVKSSIPLIVEIIQCRASLDNLNNNFIINNHNRINEIINYATFLFDLNKLSYV